MEFTPELFEDCYKLMTAFNLLKEDYEKGYGRFNYNPNMSPDQVFKIIQDNYKQFGYKYKPTNLDSIYNFLVFVNGSLPTSIDQLTKIFTKAIEDRKKQANRLKYRINENQEYISTQRANQKSAKKAITRSKWGKGLIIGSVLLGLAGIATGGVFVAGAVATATAVVKALALSAYAVGGVAVARTTAPATRKLWQKADDSQFKNNLKLYGGKGSKIEVENRQLQQESMENLYNEYKQAEPQLQQLETYLQQKNKEEQNTRITQEKENNLDNQNMQTAEPQVDNQDQERINKKAEANRKRQETRRRNKEKFNADWDEAIKENAERDKQIAEQKAKEAKEQAEWEQMLAEEQKENEFKEFLGNVNATNAQTAEIQAFKEQLNANNFAYEAPESTNRVNPEISANLYQNLIKQEQEKAQQELLDEANLKNNHPDEAKSNVDKNQTKKGNSQRNKKKKEKSIQETEENKEQVNTQDSKVERLTPEQIQSAKEALAFKYKYDSFNNSSIGEPTIKINEDSNYKTILEQSKLQEKQAEKERQAKAKEESQREQEIKKQKEEQELKEREERKEAERQKLEQEKKEREKAERQEQIRINNEKQTKREKFVATQQQNGEIAKLVKDFTKGQTNVRDLQTKLFNAYDYFKASEFGSSAVDGKRVSDEIKDQVETLDYILEQINKNVNYLGGSISLEDMVEKSSNIVDNFASQINNNVGYVNGEFSIDKLSKEDLSNLIDDLNSKLQSCRELQQKKDTYAERINIAFENASKENIKKFVNDHNANNDILLRCNKQYQEFDQICNTKLLLNNNNLSGSDLIDKAEDLDNYLDQNRFVYEAQDFLKDLQNVKAELDEMFKNTSAIERSDIDVQSAYDQITAFKQDCINNIEENYQKLQKLTEYYSQKLAIAQDRRLQIEKEESAPVVEQVTQKEINQEQENMGITKPEILVQQDKPLSQEEMLKLQEQQQQLKK